MTSEEIKKLKRETELKIAELLDDFTEKTGFYIDDMHIYYENFEYIKDTSGYGEQVFSDINVKFDIKL